MKIGSTVIQTEWEERMSVAGHTSVELLEIVEFAKSWLIEIRSDDAHHKPSPERWSISEVIGHLIDSACNNHQRFVRAQQTREFEFPDYDQEFWAAAGDYRSQDWGELVDLWYLYNRRLAVVMRNIPEELLATPCTITPYETCTLEFLVTDYVTHLNHHLTKIHERVAAETGMEPGTGAS